MTSPVVAPAPGSNTSIPDPLGILKATAFPEPTLQFTYDNLTNAGFTADVVKQQQYADQATKDGLDANGKYTVLAVYTKGLVTALFEQNVATETVNGLQAAVSHPAVCILSSPKGKTACNALDPELILNVANDLG